MVVGHHGLVQSGSNGRVSKAGNIRSFIDNGGRYVVVLVDEMEAEVWIWGLGARHGTIGASAMDE